jgi:hypothetical protein
VRSFPREFSRFAQWTLGLLIFRGSSLPSLCRHQLAARNPEYRIGKTYQRNNLVEMRLALNHKAHLLFFELDNLGYVGKKFLDFCLSGVGALNELSAPSSAPGLVESTYITGLDALLDG